MSNVKVGDVVKVRSGGGPTMTVDYIYRHAMDVVEDEYYRAPMPVRCIWYERGELQSAKFYPETLMVIDPL